MQITTLTYIGNQTARSITGCPFQPYAVVIYSHAAAGMHCKHAQSGAGIMTWSGGDISANHITSLDSGGFSISGSASGPNVTGRSYVAICFSDDIVMIEGVSYTGSGAATQTVLRSVTRPFTPVFGLISRSSLSGLVTDDNFRHTLMPATQSAILGAGTISITTGLRGFSGTAFEVGINYNANTVPYSALFFGAQAGTLAAGSYTPTGVDDRQINSGFNPTQLVITRDFGPPFGGGAGGRLRDSTHVGDSAWNFSAADAANWIQSTNANGFVVGTPNNTVYDPASVYYWLAISGGIPGTGIGGILGSIPPASVTPSNPGGGVGPGVPDARSYQRYKSQREAYRRLRSLRVI